MIFLVLILSILGPLALSCISVALVYSLIVGGGTTTAHSIGILSLATMLLIPAPIASGASVSILYRWCFAEGSARSAALLATLATLLAMICNPLVLSLVHRAEERVVHGASYVNRADLVDLLRLTQELTVVCAMTVVIVMLAVLLFELPLRWITAGLKSVEYAGVLKTLRCVLSITLIVSGWSFIAEGLAGRVATVVIEMMR